MAPDALTLDTTRKGQRSIQARQCGSIWSIILAVWLGKSSPSIALTSAAVPIGHTAWYIGLCPPAYGREYHQGARSPRGIAERKRSYMPCEQPNPDLTAGRRRGSESGSNDGVRH